MIVKQGNKVISSDYRPTEKAMRHDMTDEKQKLVETIIPKALPAIGSKIDVKGRKYEVVSILSTENNKIIEMK